MKHDQRFIYLDLVRGLSAIAVCAGHLRSAIIVDYSKLETMASPLQKTFYAVTGVGHQAVMVFFVLSGFFVGGSVLKSGGNFDWQKYVIARLARLWTVLLPALLLTAIVDMALSILSPEVLSGGFNSIWHSGPSPNEEYSKSIITFFGNLLFLQTIATPVFGTNGPIWSLANEFWYYVIFPLCAISLGRCSVLNGISTLSRIIIGLLAAFIFLMLPSLIQLRYFIWLLGLIVYFASGRLSVVSNRVVLILGAIVFIVSLAYSKSSYLHANVSVTGDVAVGVGFCIFCSALTNLSTGSLPLQFVKLSRGLSEFSYSLYLVHFPLVVLMGSQFYGLNKLQPNALGLLQFIGWLGFLLAIGAAFWWMFERRTNVIKKIVIERLKRHHT
jgi:peptidoglycan/LPS O-acetylase OafA/YrhL